MQNRTTGNTGARYYFGRVNVIGTYNEKDYDDKHRFLLESLRNSVGSERLPHSYNFFDIEELTVEGEKFIHGFLVKFQPTMSAERADTAARHIVTTEISDLTLAKCRFFLHSKTGIIAFLPKKPVMPPTLFANQFRASLRGGNLLVDAEVQMIEDRQRVMEQIGRFDTISSLSITLHPSNPDSSHLWEKIDKRLQEKHISTYQEQFFFQPKERPSTDPSHSTDGKVTSGKTNGGGRNREAKPNGVNPEIIRDDDDIKSKVTMAEDGYGKAVVSGIANGKPKTVSTSDNPVTAPAPSDRTEPPRILEGIFNVFKNLFGRNDGQ